MSYSLFSVFGIEIEYALIGKDSLRVDASVDRLIQALAGNPDDHPQFGNVELDNELAAHVLEFKCKRPTQDLISQTQDFNTAVKAINKALGGWATCLLPGGMHPFMDPTKESILWNHEDKSIYQAYDRIFGCRGHGWFNIQSVHLNLPFANDTEFSQLHNAISLLLPLLPSLAAASPIFDGQHNGWLDSRLFHYIGNQRRLPSIIGNIIPEPVGSEEEYQEKILRPMYKEIAPWDPEGLLQEEWLNSRAAIARFDRGAIEIRCMDTQERPLADIALCHWVISVLQMMLASGTDYLGLHRQVPEGMLKAFFLDTACHGMSAKIPAGFPLKAFFPEGLEGLEGAESTEVKGERLGHEPPITVKDLLLALTHRVRKSGSRHMAAEKEWTFFSPAIDLILEQGNLSNRILKAAGTKSYPQIYTHLAQCLSQDQPFLI